MKSGDYKNWFQCYSLIQQQIDAFIVQETLECRQPCLLTLDFDIFKHNWVHPWYLPRYYLEDFLQRTVSLINPLHHQKNPRSEQRNCKVPNDLQEEGGISEVPYSNQRGRREESLTLPHRRTLPLWFRNSLDLCFSGYNHAEGDKQSKWHTGLIT